MKALYTDITEGESTIAIFQKNVTEYKEKQTTLTEELENLRQKKLLIFQDLEVQLVLRGGIVELPLSGFISDFNEAILVSRTEVEEINSIIIKVGKKKIKAMEDVMKFKRGILSKEWEHKRLQMRITDLKDTLHYIHSMKVTKEVQAYLKSRARNEKEEKITFEQEVALIKKSYERIIEEMRAQITEIKVKINEIKRQNKKLDQKIGGINVDVCEFKLEYDYEADQKEKEMVKFRLEV